LEMPAPKVYNHWWGSPETILYPKLP